VQERESSKRVLCCDDAGDVVSEFGMRICPFCFSVRATVLHSVNHFVAKTIIFSGLANHISPKKSFLVA
jgi:hypothetical protein